MMTKLIFNPVTIIILGFLTPAASTLVFLIPFALMIIMFISFSGIEAKEVISKSIRPYRAIITMVIMGLFTYAVLMNLNKNLALAGLLLFLTPTAVSAPAITKIVKKDQKFVSINVIYTNISFSLIFTFILFIAAATKKLEMLQPSKIIYIVGIILIPFSFSQLLRFSLPHIALKIAKSNKISFYLWLLVLFLASSNVGKQLYPKITAISLEIAGMFILAAIIFFVSYFTGKLIGTTKKFEIAQSLSQKNTMIAFWIAITYLPEPISLAPLFYSLIQNIWYSLIVAATHNDNIPK